MTPIEELTALEMAEAARAAKAVAEKEKSVLNDFPDASTQPPEVLQVAVLDPTSATPNAFKIQTVNELAETTNTAVANQPVEVPPATVIVATSAVPVPKPSVFGRLKAEVELVEREVKQIATEIEDAV
jgi:hypothetical protein